MPVAKWSSGKGGRHWKQNSTSMAISTVDKNTALFENALGGIHSVETIKVIVALKWRGTVCHLQANDAVG